MSGLGQTLQPLDDAVYKKLTRYFDSTRELLLFSDIILNELKALKIKPDELNDFRILILYCYFKTTSNGISMWLVASTGHHVEASILLRPIIELYIQLGFVVKQNRSEHESLSKLFFDYLRFREKKNVQFAYEIARELNEAEMANNLRNQLNALNREFAGKKHTDFEPWNQIESVAKKAGLFRYYRTVYNPYSKFTHSSLDCINEFYNSTAQIWAIKPSLKHLDQILVVFYEAYISIIDVLAAEFWGHPFKAFDGFVKELNSLKTDSEERLTSTN